MKTELSKRQKEILWADYRDNCGEFRDLSIQWDRNEFLVLLNDCYAVLSQNADSYEGEEKSNLIEWAKIFLLRFEEVYLKKLQTTIDRKTMAQAERLVIDFVGC